MRLAFLSTFLLVACGLVAQPGGGRPERYLEESFGYPNGNLREVSGRTWTRVQGDAGIEVVNREAVIGPFVDGREGYLARRFARAPSGPVFELLFALRVDPPEGGEALQARGETFLQLGGRGGEARRGRVALRAAPDGQSLRLGVATKTSSRVRWAQRDLAFGQVHLVRMVYDSATGRSWLWVNPIALDEAPHAESLEEDGMEIDRLVIQTGPGIGSLRLRISRVVLQRGTVPEVPVAPVVEAAPVAPPPSAVPPPVAAGAMARSAVTPPAPENLWVFVLAGQSNMAGRGVVEEIDRTPNPRILVWQRDGSWALATEPLHDDKPQVAGVGPGLAFARALLAQVPEGVSIGLVPVAFGGTRIAWWDRDYVGRQRWEQGPTYYQHLITATRAAQQQGTLKGILWNQGSSDYGAARADGGATYRTALHALIHNLREDLGNPRLPFVAATLGPWRTGSDAINAVYLALPQEVPGTAVVDTLRERPVLRNKDGDPAHYDSASARRLGELYAAVTWPLLTD